MREFWSGAFWNAYAGFDFMMMLYALMAAVALLVIMRATGLMRQEARWRQWFVCLYYVYIPIVFITCAAGWNLVGPLESTVVGAINDARPAISATSTEYASNAWKKGRDHLRQGPVHLPARHVPDRIRDYAEKLMDGFIPGETRSVLPSAVAFVASGIKEGAALAIARTVEEIALKKAADATSADKGLLLSFWSADLKKALSMKAVMAPAAEAK